MARSDSRTALPVASNYCFTFAMGVAASAGVRTRALRNADPLEPQTVGWAHATVSQAFRFPDVLSGR